MIPSVALEAGSELRNKIEILSNDDICSGMQAMEKHVHLCTGENIARSVHIQRSTSYSAIGNSL